MACWSGRGQLDPAWGLAWSNVTFLSMANTSLQSTLPAGAALASADLAHSDEAEQG